MIDMHCFARKGTGSLHAKWSPVGELTCRRPSSSQTNPVIATASYRLLPHIIIREPIPEEDQEKFQKCFPPGVIALEEDSNGDQQVVVKNPRKDTVSREVLRHPEFKDKVELTRIRDHFICEWSDTPIHDGQVLIFCLTIDSVESTGQYRPEELVPEAIKILLSKIADVEAGLDKIFPSDA